MDLFVDSSLQFEKKAAEVPLPEDANKWPEEVLQELYKQVPYISDFEPHVVMDKVDPERGYAFGHVEVSNKSEIQRGASPAGVQAAGIKSVKVPVIVKSMKLQPFDVLITANNDMLPLTEARLRQAVFRPQAFDITGRGPGDQSIIGQLYPPYRQNYGFGGGGSVSSAGTKEGSAPSTLLDRVLPTINAADRSAFFQKLADKNLQAAFHRNSAAAADAISKIAVAKPVYVSKLASVLSDITPSVVQVMKATEGYIVKSANHNFWEPKEELYDRGRLVHEFGVKLALEVDGAGSATLTTGATSDATPQPEEDQYELIKDFGMYKVKDTEERELVGYVFPNLLDLDGTPLPIFLFTNGSQSAVQGEIVGVHVGGGVSLMEGNPRGHGAFYEVLSNGKAQATIPMTIQATLDGGEGMGGVTLHGETFDGRPVEVSVQPNITKILFEDGRLAVPETMRWLPLDSSEEVILQGNADTVSKVAHAQRGDVVVQIRCGGIDSFSFRGEPVEKVASEERDFLSADDALFLLSGLGVTPAHAVQKLAEAYTHQRPIEVMTGRSLSTMEEQVFESRKTASSKLEGFPNLRRDLVKEAAVLPDPTAVDTVLSLGFLNPENINIFLAALPELDAAQKKLCELVIASRLGMRDVPVPALESAIRSVEEVIEGLKVLAFSKN